MKTEELLENTKYWDKKDKGKFTNTETGNTVEVFPKTDNQDDIITVRASLYTPNKIQKIAEADTVDELYKDLMEFFNEYNQVVGLV